MSCELFTAAEIDEILEEEGREVTFRRYSTTPDNAAEPYFGPSIDLDDMEEVTVFAVQDQGPPSRLDRIVDGNDGLGQMTLITRSDEDLEAYTELLDGDQIWQVSSLRRISPGEVNYLYEVLVKR